MNQRRALTRKSVFACVNCWPQFLEAYLAEQLNKSVSTVSGYESDAHPVPTDVLISMAELFGISLDALLNFERPMGVSTQGLSTSQIKSFWRFVTLLPFS